MLFLKGFFEKVNFEKNQQTTKSLKNSPAYKELMNFLQIVYENTAYSLFDQAYVSSLVKTVLHNIYTDTSGTLVLGTVAIPTPPANVGKL